MISIYLLSYVAWLTVKNIENSVATGLSLLFIFFTVSGFINAMTLGFSFDAARAVDDRFSFVFFEYPHSAGIFLSVLLPLYFLFIHKGMIPRLHYSYLYAGIPIAILYSGARVALLTYIISLGLTMVTIHGRSVVGVSLIALGLFFGGFFIIGTDIYISIFNIFEIPLSEYVNDTRGYSINSTHTRIKVWAYMFFHSIDNNTISFGNGYRSWGLVYKDLWGFGSAQSDYFTSYFELGLYGLLGLLIYKFGSLFMLLRKSNHTCSQWNMIAIGVFSGLVLGGFTENTEGYASTSWLLPVLFAYAGACNSRYLSQWERHS